MSCIKVLDTSWLTRFVSCVSIMKLWTCFSALVSSSFLDRSATRNAVHPAPYATSIERKITLKLVLKIKTLRLWKIHPLILMLSTSSYFLIVVERFYAQLTMIPVLTAMPRPQYVFGTISPKPTLKNVIAISHMELRRLACSSSWNLNHKFIFGKSISLVRKQERAFISFFFREKETFHTWLESSKNRRATNRIIDTFYLTSDQVFYLPPFRMSRWCHGHNKCSARYHHIQHIKKW